MKAERLKSSDSLVYTFELSSYEEGDIKFNVELQNIRRKCDSLRGHNMVMLKLGKCGSVQPIAEEITGYVADLNHVGGNKTIVVIRDAKVVGGRHPGKYDEVDCDLRSIKQLIEYCGAKESVRS